MKVIDDFAYRLADNLALMFGDKCEVVIHDFSKGLDQTIVKLCNGHVTNREVGACPPGSFWEKVGSLETATDLLPYFKHTEDGRIIKTNATFIRNSYGKVVGSLCINFDVTGFIKSQEFIADFVKYDKDSESNTSEPSYHNVDEVFEHYLLAVTRLIGKPGSQMSKEEKLRSIEFLDNKGVLKISKASDLLCSFFGVSRYTFYAYLDEARKRKREKSREESDT